MRDRIEQLSGDVPGLERLYRRAVKQGRQDTFRQALAQCLEQAPDDVLLLAWAHRLDLRPAPADEAPREAVEHSGAPSPELAAADTAGNSRRWLIALPTSLACGVLFALMAGDKPPVPAPEAASPWFWIGWGPTAALALLAFLAAATPQRQRLRPYAAAAGAVLLVALVSALGVWGLTNHAANLVALHLPFLAWAVVGGAVTSGRPDPAGQFYAFMVESMETLVAGGVYLGAGVIFGVLTTGIFAVLGLQIPEGALLTALAFGIGAIPVLALASVYNPALAPVQQGSGTGLARIIRIMTWLLLPLALGVLALYVLWFIPAYFWRPFQQRQALIVYNATIIAVLVLMAAAVSPAANRRAPGSQPTKDSQPAQGLERALRPAVLSLAALTLLLNVYSLAAITSRTYQYGLSPNRQAVIGWNLVTLLMLGYVLTRSWQAPRESWLVTFRTALATSMTLAIAWAAWVVVGLPHT